MCAKTRTASSSLPASLYPRRNQNSRPRHSKMEAGWKWKRYGTGIMFFLLRVAFWLVVVLALLPSGGAQQSAQAKVGATDAMIAAGAAVSDMTNFCDRQPEACAVGAKTAVVIGQRAQAGARMVYEFINEHALRDSEKNATHGG